MLHQIKVRMQLDLFRYFGKIRNMKINAVQAFRALAHETRLAVFRTLLKKGHEGMPAGQIAMRLDVPTSTLSTHLSLLEQTGLLYSRREKQRILYAVNLDGVQSLLRFLIEDCCAGKPEMCGYELKSHKNAASNAK